MAHNFKLTGNFYISKAGVATNTGLTPDSPRELSGSAIAASGGADTIIIGAGQYILDGTIGAAGRKFKADGYVKWTSAGSGNTLFSSASLNNTFENIAFEGYTGNVWGRAGSSGSVHFYGCYFENCHFNTTSWSTTEFYDSVFLDCTGSIAVAGAANGTYRVNHNLFINSPITVGYNTSATSRGIANNYFDAASTGTLFNYNVTTNNFGYAATYSGTNGNINQAPHFNNTVTRDYSLRPNSPHLSRNIGPRNLRLASSFVLQGSAGRVTPTSNHYFANSASNEQFPVYGAENMTSSLQNGQLRMKVVEQVGGALTSKFRVKIKVSEVPIELGIVDFISGLNYNTSYPAAESLFDANNPEVLNNNVPNGYNWSSGHAGRNPNRLDYSMRWSNKDQPSLAVDTDWVSGANRLIMEWNQVPRYNPISLYGNADPLFLPAPVDTLDTPKPIIATWLDVEVTLMNNYFSQ